MRKQQTPATQGTPLSNMQVARELPRDWKLDTPDAQHLLAELLRDLPPQNAGEEGGDLASSPFLLGLDRSHAQMCSPSSTQPISLGADSPEQASQASAISPTVCPQFLFVCTIMRSMLDVWVPRSELRVQ